MSLLIPECCVNKLAATMQTNQFPLWAMDGLYYRFYRVRQGPHICFIGNHYVTHRRSLNLRVSQ